MSHQKPNALLASGFSEEWEQRYKDGSHHSIWPWSDVVAYVNRYARPQEAYSVVLELGCGAGANIPFFLARADDYHAVEGSATMVAALLERFPSLVGKIFAADFTKVIPFEVVFDMVLDRCSVTHNDTDAIVRCLGLVAGCLREGGLFIGIDWFTDEHSDAQNGVWVDDHTRRGDSRSAMHHVGKMHFSDRVHLEGLLRASGFELLLLEQKTVQVVIGAGQALRDTFNFVAVKT